MAGRRSLTGAWIETYPVCEIKNCPNMSLPYGGVD